MIENDWKPILNEALNTLDREYLEFLRKNEGYFPDFENFLNAFKTLPLKKTKAILFGQDPYPREKSAIGYAFIDGMVEEIFSKNGFSKQVNKATSLRNFLKMQLCAEGFLTKDVSQGAISKLAKQNLIQNILDLKKNFEKEGILLLNRALIFTNKKQTRVHVKAFKPFVKSLLNQINDRKIDLILFGNEAKTIHELLPPKHNFTLLNTPHPYNVSFIQNEVALEYFSKLKLLSSS